jgi:hypothetical protein
MITILINGRIKDSVKVEQYMFSLMKELKIHRFKNKLIQLNVVTRLENMYGNGWGCAKNGVAEINIARWIGKERVTYDLMLQTIAHEMVHVKQYFRKELDGSNVKWKWKGRNADGYRYENQPWEREANRLELPLYQKCWPL